MITAIERFKQRRAIQEKLGMNNKPMPPIPDEDPDTIALLEELRNGSAVEQKLAKLLEH